MLILPAMNVYPVMYQGQLFLLSMMCYSVTFNFIYLKSNRMKLFLVFFTIMVGYNIFLFYFNKCNVYPICVAWSKLTATERSRYLRKWYVSYPVNLVNSLVL
jgi:hypothetical protein